MTTPPEPKAPEPSDDELLAICDEAFSVNHQRSAENRALYNAGRAALAAEVEALKAERDKLHAAIAWREKHPRLVHDAGKRWYAVGCSEFSPAKEEHDDTDAGRAAALVRLFERCTK